MDVGLELRQARERRGLSLLQLSQITKISLRVLQAIEASDERALPAPVFTRSFVKTYAAEVGLAPDDTLRRYLEQFEPAEPPGGESAVISAPEPPPPSRKTPAFSPGRVLQGRFGNAVLLCLVGVTAFLLAGRNRQAESAAAPQDSGPAVSSAGFAPAASPSPSPVATSGTVPAAAGALQIAIAPTGPCWVQATVDGQAAIAKLLDAGDRRLVEAPSAITLRVGDPATFAFSINGAPAKIPGSPGQAVTINVTRENFRQFLVQ